MNALHLAISSLVSSNECQISGTEVLEGQLSGTKVLVAGGARALMRSIC
jgi:hypothetical protein